MMDRIFEFAAQTPSLITWQEMYDLTSLAQPASFADIKPIFVKCIETLEKRKKDGICVGKQGAPRYLVTGCPVGGDAAKVFNVIEEAGGVIVAIDNCTGMKTFLDTIDEDSLDPIPRTGRAVPEAALLMHVAKHTGALISSTGSSSALSLMQ